MYLLYLIDALFNFESAFEMQTKTEKEVNAVHLRVAKKQQRSEQNQKWNLVECYISIHSI